MAVQVSGIEEPLTIDMRLFEWDKTYLNPLYGKCTPSVDFPRLFALYAEGALLLDEQVTRTYPLANVADAFADMLAGRNAKGVVVLGPPSGPSRSATPSSRSRGCARSPSAAPPSAAAAT